MNRPNFFIIGAPKSGTSALAQYLSEHPAVFFSAPKELHFWDNDHAGARDVHGIPDLNSYLQRFSPANPDQHRLIGEGSTTYFQSREAVRAIREFQPDARFIVMLRNPVEVAHGMHGELLLHGHEDVQDFEQAWRLQQVRSAGEQLPASRFFRHQLQYRDVATFAPQLERFFSLVPANQRRVIIFDDFTRNTADVYRSILRFLDLPDDNRHSFPKVNPARAYRLGLIGKLYHNPPQMLEPVIGPIRRRIAASSGGLKELLRKAVTENRARSRLSAEFEAEVRDAFRDDITEISRLLGRDLSHWTAPLTPLA